MNPSTLSFFDNFASQQNGVATSAVTPSAATLPVNPSSAVNTPVATLSLTHPANSMFSNLLFPQQTTEDFASQLQLFSSATAANKSQLLPAQLQNAQTTQNILPNAMICTQLELLQQMQLAKQQDQQREQYKLALIQELINLDQQKSTATVASDLLTSTFLQQQQQQLQMNNSPISNALFQQPLNNNLTSTNNFLFNTSSLGSTNFTQPLLNQFFMDSHASLSQATSKANSPFGNIRTAGEEELTAQQMVAPIQENKPNNQVSYCYEQSQLLQQQQQQLSKPNQIRFPRELFGDDADKIRQERLMKIERFRNKRRSWMKKISYDCRKRVADARLRVKGRFISKVDTQKIKELVGPSTEEAFNAKKNLRLELLSDQMREKNLHIERATSKGEILKQIERLLAKNKVVHAEQTMAAVLSRIRSKKQLFSMIQRKTMVKLYCDVEEEDEDDIEDSQMSLEQV